MAKKMDPMLIEILTNYGERAENAVWDCHGTWVAYHKAIERIAAKAGVEWTNLTVIEANSKDKIVAISVEGKLGDRKEWSFGEAAPNNNKNAYPYAMAEKRAKDRVVLKLIGLHGLLYSEEEADDFKYGETADTKAPKGKTASNSASYKRGLTMIDNELIDCHTIAQVNKLAQIWSNTFEADNWPEDYVDLAKPKFQMRREAIRKAQENEAEDSADFPGDTPTLLAG